MGWALRRIIARRCAGTAWPPTREMRLPRTASGRYTGKAAWGYRATTTRRCAGTAWRLTRAMRAPRTISGCCTRTAGASRRITTRRCAGTARPPTRDLPERDNHIGMLYANGWGVTPDRGEAKDWM